MRCPKCHYISFGSVDRCRNCGYELSFAPEAKPLDLPIQNADEPVGPMRDLQLGERGSAQGMTEQTPAGRSATAPRLDLPLFSDRAIPDDAPLISAPSVPRPPLAVRRAQPAVPRPKPEKGPGESAAVRKRGLPNEPAVSPSGELVVAPILARLVAGVIDVVILLSIDGAVLYFTLRVLELPVADIAMLPPVPLAVFLLLLNGGYLATFTAAGGQTIGKMLAGIKVVAERPADDQGFDGFSLRVTLGAAVLRAAAYLVSLMPAGLGFAAILFDADGRALHDRLSDTRVIKA
jgi:uncharacterized RDD family membrane protein YckC